MTHQSRDLSLTGFRTHSRINGHTPINLCISYAASMEQDLTTLLTIEQRADLTLLVANITEVMHKQIEEVFEASHEHHSGTQKTPRLLETSDQNPNLLTSENESQEETEEEKKARRLREKREKELSAPKLLELKRDVLDSFEKWQMSIISRVGEVINSKETAEKQHKEEATVKATPDAAPVVAHKAISEFMLFENPSH